MTRRTFTGIAAGAAALLEFPQQQVAAEIPHRQLKTLPYGAVRLLDGPLKRQFDQNHSFFLNLSEDRMLKIYRQRAGLPAPGENMGGWYDDFCPGAHFGQYLSALARFAQATGSEPTRAKVKRLVNGYGKVVATNDRYFVDLRYPAYTYDKLVCGLMDAHQCAGVAEARAILQATTTAARPHMPDRALTPDERKTWPHKDETYTWDEAYTLAENLFLAHEVFGDRQYFDMAQRYLLDKTFFDPLSQGKYILPGLHAYSHANALSSGMQGYFKLGNPKYLKAVTNAVNAIWQDQSYATGGWGPNEAFVEPGKGKLAASLSDTHRSFETPCGAYAHLKVMRYLLTLTGDPKYGDSMEQVVYNTVLGAKPIQPDGHSFYYSDYHDDGYKTLRRVVPNAKYAWDRDGRWPCCSGTLPQVAADYVINSYFQSADNLYINLYIPSRITFRNGSKQFHLVQKTEYPMRNLVHFEWESPSAGELALNLRIPAWAGEHTSVSVNGQRLKEPIKPGSFYALRRSWKSGDQIDLELDQRVSTKPVDAQNKGQVAIVRGSQVLFGVGRTSTLTEAQNTNPRLIETNDGGWTLQGTDTTLLPFSVIKDQHYRTYWRVSRNA